MVVGENREKILKYFMNRNINLLVKGLFDDNELFNRDDYEDDIEVADQLVDYSIGNIYYQDKEPYAICCGLKKDFKDNKSRFVTINQEYYTNISNINVIIPELYLENFYAQDISSLKYIDENGYYNTQSVLKSDWYKPGTFPAF